MLKKREGKVNSRAENDGNSDIQSIIKTEVKTEISNQQSKKSIQKRVLDALTTKIKAFIVFGDSIKNKFQHGTIVPVKRTIRWLANYNEGDFIVFKVKGTDIKIIHKIVKITGDGQYITQGINSENSQTITISKRDIIGKVEMSENNIDKINSQWLDGKLKIDIAYGLFDIKEINFNMMELLKDYYGENTYEDVKSNLFDILPKRFRATINQWSPRGNEVFTKKNEEYTRDDTITTRLDAFIYILDELRGQEDDTATKDHLLKYKNMIIAYAKAHKIPLAKMSYYPPQFYQQNLRGALILNHINKFAGFDILMGKQLSDSIFENVATRDKKGKITYILHHFLLEMDAILRKQSISKNEILVTNGENHWTYDNIITQDQTMALIEAWETLMAEGMENGEINPDDIERIFANVYVGEVKEGREEESIVYNKYEWELQEMVNIINEFLDAKLDNELDQYIGGTEDINGRWPNLFNRWRSDFTDISIEQQIYNAYKLIYNRYKTQGSRFQLNIKDLYDYNKNLI